MDMWRAYIKAAESHLPDADIEHDRFENIIAYLKHRISNAATEGFNAVIQSIKANARGFRNFENYRVAILFQCGKFELKP